ncbi:MAG TPA: hypothetical protein VFS44_10825 [Gemmatimonadaceae bacterium]|nr:hypothetical protein [Gemmatimonadaceae bacterium]
MHKRSSSLAAAFAAGAAILLASSSAQAQAWHYPAFQPPTISTREFNFAVAGGGDYGTTGVFQWREGIGPDTHLSMDIGFADPDFGDTGFLIGGGIGQRIMRATAETPIDLVLTGGLYGEFGVKPSIIRLPLGVSVGHRFPIEGTKTAITPYVHPRLSIDMCASDCEGIDTKVKVNFDFGADFEVTRQLSLRGAFTVGGVSEADSKVGFGFGLAFHPVGVRTAARR